MQIVIRGSKWIEEQNVEDSHWRFVVSLNGEGVHHPNLLVMSFNNGSFQVVNLNAPLQKVPIEYMSCLAKEVPDHE